jgi:hypothetical protein
MKKAVGGTGQSVESAGSGVEAAGDFLRNMPN